MMAIKFSILKLFHRIFFISRTFVVALWIIAFAVFGYSIASGVGGKLAFDSEVTSPLLSSGMKSKAPLTPKELDAPIHQILCHYHRNRTLTMTSSFQFSFNVYQSKQCGILRSKVDASMPSLQLQSWVFSTWQPTLPY